MLTTLRRIIQDVSSTSQFKEALDIMVNQTAQALQADACSIFLLDRRRGEYVLFATLGLNTEAVGKVRLPQDKGLIGLVGEREEPVNIDDASKHPRYIHVAEVKEEIFRAFLGVPIIYHRQVLGVLFVQQKEQRRYDESEEAFLVTLATQFAAGRMGQVTVKAVEAEPGLELVGQTGPRDKLSEQIQKTQAQVVIDFTQPSAVYDNTVAILQAGARPVIGTTGLSLRQIKKLQERSQKLRRGGIIAPNFSIGMALMMKYAAEFAQYFPDLEIIEMHHDRKKDAPSGTALLTAEILAKARKRAGKKLTAGREKILPGSRGANYQGIPIHAVRLPGFLAHEQIIFGDLGETLTLRHDTSDRQCFMRGVVLACKRVMKLKRLVYGLGTIL